METNRKLSNLALIITSGTPSANPPKQSTQKAKQS